MRAFQNQGRAIAAKSLWGRIVCRAAAGCAFLLAVGGCPLVGVPTSTDDDIHDATVKWNNAAIDASGLDHTAVKEGENRVFGHNLGPGRATRAMAITHIAIFDVANALTGGKYESYTRTPVATKPTNANAAISQAAHDTIVALYPSHAPGCDAALAESLASIPDGASKTNGIALGKEVAARILAMRDKDGSEIAEPYQPSDAPGAWRPDPINPTQQPLGEEWFHVKPFVMNSATQFRVPPPPALDSQEYADAFNEEVRLGGDGVTTPTERNEEQTIIGIFWAYDGTPSLCAPPRLYNQVASKVADDYGVHGLERARLMAMVNVALADSCLAIWESKYYYNFWRPICAIREADGAGPSGLDDGNPDTAGDEGFVPLCAPASNLTGPNFTPPFPAYPSGHSGMGGATFEILRNYFGTDDVPFSFVSQEFNGVTKDNEGNVRPRIERSYNNLSEPELENGRSRVYLGIHWAFDITEGIQQGNEVADYVWGNVFQKVK